MDPKSIPVVILCGGEGTRFREETQYRPKPLISIGESPILWHVMNIYASQGFSNFILCLGYKGWMIKDYFLSYEVHRRNFTIRLDDGAPVFHGEDQSPGWRITFVDTGLRTMTGARVKRVEKYVESEHLMVTYADGLADIDLRKLLDFHLGHGRIGTVTGVLPRSQFGEMILAGSRVTRFTEKPQVTSIINGGFFVFRREVFRYLEDGDGCVLERDTLTRLADAGELHAYRHDGFWQCLDTYKDHLVLEEIWRAGKAQWCPAK